MKTSKDAFLSKGKTWKRTAVALAAPLAIVLLGTAVGVANSAGQPNEDARRLQEAKMVLRTNQWLEEHNFDPSSSKDMKEALTVFCKELRARGGSC